MARQLAIAVEVPVVEEVDDATGVGRDDLAQLLRNVGLALVALDAERFVLLQVLLQLLLQLPPPLRARRPPRAAREMTGRLGGTPLRW